MHEVNEIHDLKGTAVALTKVGKEPPERSGGSFSFPKNALALSVRVCHDVNMEIRNSAELVKGQIYTVRGTVSGQVGATFRGRFGSELLFCDARGEHWTVPVAYFVSAVPCV